MSRSSFAPRNGSIADRDHRFQDDRVSLAPEWKLQILVFKWPAVKNGRGRSSVGVQKVLRNANERSESDTSAVSVRWPVTCNRSHARPAPLRRYLPRGNFKILRIIWKTAPIPEVTKLHTGRLRPAARVCLPSYRKLHSTVKTGQNYSRRVVVIDR